MIVVSASENCFAGYLVRDGAINITRLVVFRRMFGRVRELWMLDMGLGPRGGDFESLLEDKYDDLMREADEEDDDVVEILDDESEEADDKAIDDGGGQDVLMVLYGVDQQ